MSKVQFRLLDRPVSEVDKSEYSRKRKTLTLDSSTPDHAREKQVTIKPNKEKRRNDPIVTKIRILSPQPSDPLSRQQSA